MFWVSGAPPSLQKNRRSTLKPKMTRLALPLAQHACVSVSSIRDSRRLSERLSAALVRRITGLGDPLAVLPLTVTWTREATLPPVMSSRSIAVPVSALLPLIVEL